MTLQQLTLTARRLLAALLTAAAVAYIGLLVAVYIETTPPSALGPDVRELDRLLCHVNRPISLLEWRLMAANAPLGTGPLIRESRPSSLEQIADTLTPTELAERECERQALLDWIRSGANQAAFEEDDYVVANPAAVSSLSPKFLVPDECLTSRPRVRIRSIINARCANCHDEDGDDTARLIPLDSYQMIALYLQPDDRPGRGRAALIAALVALFPLAAIAGIPFAFTSRPLATRGGLLAVTFAALILVGISWSFGSWLAPLLLCSASLAAVSSMLMILATASELVGYPAAPSFWISGLRLEAQKA